MESWERRRDQLEEWRASGARETDKIIVTVSSGVVAFSAAFVRDIQELKMSGLVGYASGALLVSIIFVLVALIAERIELRKRIKDLNTTQIESDVTWRNYLISTANLLSGVTFVSGIGAIAWFLMANAG